MRILTVGLVCTAIAVWEVAPARADYPPGRPLFDEARREQIRIDSQSECSPETMRRPGEECTYCDVNQLRPTCDAFFRAGGWERRCSTYDPERDEVTGAATPYEVGCRPIREPSAPAPASAPPQAPRTSGCAVAPGAGGGAAPLLIALVSTLAAARRARRRRPPQLALRALRERARRAARPS